MGSIRKLALSEIGAKTRYGSTAIALHWISAVAIIAMLGTGFAAAFSSEQKVAILRIHVPLGVIVLVLTLTRIVWRFFDTRPQHLAGQRRWQTLVAHGVHGLLYMAIIVMCVSGLGLMALSGAAAVLFFGASDPLLDFSTFAPMAAHALAAFALIALVCAHFGAALYHQFVRGDRLLSRMGIGRVG